MSQLNPLTSQVTPPPIWKERTRAYRQFSSRNNNFDYLIYFQNIDTSIDYIVIFVNDKWDIPRIFSQYLHLYKMYGNVSKFLLLKYEIVVRKITKTYARGFSIYIHHPDTFIINTIHNILNSNNIKYNITRIEYTIDVYTSYLKELFSDTKISAIIKRQSNKNLITKKYRTTFYLANPRKDRNKAGRVYIKNINGCDVVRIEAILKNEFIKRKYGRIGMPIMAGKTAEDIFSIFQFRKFDLTRFFSNQSKLMQDNLKTLQSIYHKIISPIYEEGFHTVNENLSSYKLKNKNNYFSLHPLHHAFFNAIKGRHFI